MPFGIFCDNGRHFNLNLFLFALAWPLGMALGLLAGILAFTLLTIPIEVI
jgi:hypothetical protein